MIMIEIYCIRKNGDAFHFFESRELARTYLLEIIEDTRLCGGIVRDISENGFTSLESTGYPGLFSESLFTITEIGLIEALNATLGR